MKQDPAQSAQLLLTVPVITLEISHDTERLLISALADLLLEAALHGQAVTEGGSDEREDS